MKQLSTIKESTIKRRNAGIGMAYTGLFSVAVLTAMFMLVTPALAKSGFSSSFLVSNSYYKGSRLDHGYGGYTHRGIDYFWESFFNISPRRHFDRRHKHKAWDKHRHDHNAHLKKHIFNQRHCSDQKNHNHFRRR
jgi:hypothetical protein